MIGETSVKVRYSETDQMGVVYYANYFVWFEVARTDFFKSLGHSYKELEKKDIYLPVVESYCKYKISAEYDDDLIIKTKIDFLKNIRIKFNYEVFHRKDMKLIAEGSTLHAFVDSNKKPTPLKKHNTEIWNKLKDSIVK